MEDLVEFPEEDEIPVSVATNGQNLVFVGTNAALYEFNIKTKIVSFFKLRYPKFSVLYHFTLQISIGWLTVISSVIPLALKGFYL